MRRLFAAPALAAFVLALALPGTAAFAQEEGVARKTIRANAGEVFEILAVTNDENPEYGWVLTKNGTLVEAGRDRIFRTRLNDEGTYTLDGSARTAEGDHRLIVTVLVGPAEESSSSDEAPTTLDVVSTNPPTVNGTLSLRPDSPLITVLPSSVVTGPVTVDLDSTVDSDGDGVPTNDNDAGDTFFANEHSALQLWYVSTADVGALLFSGEAADGTPLIQRIALAGEGAAEPQGEIRSEPQGNGMVKFEMPLESTLPRENVVIAWDFGDGRRSLIDEPVHRYAFDGDYTVKAVVRELQTGRELTHAEAVVHVTGTTGMPVSSASSVSSGASSSSVASEPSSGGGLGSMIGTIFRILLLGGFAIAIGALAVWGGSKLLKREGKLQKTLEDAEKKLLGKDAAVTSDAPPPMELKRAAPVAAPPTSAPAEVVTPPPAPAPSPEPAPASEPVKDDSIESAVKDAQAEDAAKPLPPGRDPTAPPVAEVPAPPWLQKGLEAAKPDTPAGSQPSPAPIATPAPVSEQTSPVAAPAAPSPVSELPVEASADDLANALPESELLPPWLRDENQKPDAAAPAPAPAPAEPPATPATVPVEPPVTPLPVVEPTPVAPAPAPEPIPAPAPEPIPEPPVAPAPEVVTPPPAAPVPEIVTPLAPAPVTPAPQTPAPAAPAPATLNPEDAARLERERERKRKKRQRYRDNVKKRKEETPKPAAPIPTPVAAAPAKQAPVEPKQIPPAAPVAKSPKPAAIPKDIPLALPADDSVAFIVRAESVEKKPSDPPVAPAKSSPAA